MSRCRAGLPMAILLAVAWVAPASAASLDARAAQAVISGCASHAAAKSQSHAIVVVDLGGHIVASLRMDGNSYGIADFALAKAQAAVAWGFSTAQMAESAAATPGFGDAPNVVTVPGGLPIFSADGAERIGAVGVSGEAPPDDAACAEAGIKAAGLRTTRQAR